MARQSKNLIKKENFARKYIEQQATKAFIKKDDKPRKQAFGSNR